MEKSFVFNSVNGDRRYKAEDFREYFASFISNGVFPNPSNNLQVIANNDMTITIKAGKGWINGAIYINTDDYILNIDVADGVLNRIDKVVLRMDTAERKIYSYVKKGQFASSPTAPTLQRDADAYEIALADVAVNKGAISITQANITDLRLDKNLCGIVHGTVDQIDVTTLFNQYSTRFKIKSEEFEKEFEDWLKTLKDVLGEDTAGNLLNLITKNTESINNIKSDLDDITTKQGELKNLKTTNKTNLVNAVNELFTSASNGKIKVATAITGKGVLASSSDSFDTLSNKIGQISTNNIKSIQKGSRPASTGSNSIMDFTINAVNVENSIILIQPLSGGQEDAQFAEFVSSTKIRLSTKQDRKSPWVPWYKSSHPYYWTVIEFQNIKSIQKGVQFFDSWNRRSIVINPVNVNNSLAFANFAGWYDTTTTGMSANIVASNKLDIEVYGGGLEKASWSVVEFF
ncbi:hypothetical protein [Clostridium botulinum]|uniref:hypothetical protein n=1 Tax=Clostridium botulinum TaxID=1491 RepID=UPI001F391519|nr:hypothetical protein [Clostridium botulinum]